MSKDETNCNGGNDIPPPADARIAIQRPHFLKQVLLSNNDETGQLINTTIRYKLEMQFWTQRTVYHYHELLKKPILDQNLKRTLVQTSFISTCNSLAWLVWNETLDGGRFLNSARHQQKPYSFQETFLARRNLSVLDLPLHVKKLGLFVLASKHDPMLPSNVMRIYGRISTVNLCVDRPNSTNFWFSWLQDVKSNPAKCDLHRFSLWKRICIPFLARAHGLQ